MIKPGPAGFFDEHTVVTAQCAQALAEYGVEPRHLRAFRSAADRQSDLIAQIAGPVVKAEGRRARPRRRPGSRGGGARDHVAHVADQVGRARRIWIAED